MRAKCLWPLRGAGACRASQGRRRERAGGRRDRPSRHALASDRAPPRRGAARGARCAVAPGSRGLPAGGDPRGEGRARRRREQSCARTKDRGATAQALGGQGHDGSERGQRALEPHRARKAGRKRRAAYELKSAGLRPDEVRQAKANLEAGRAALDALVYQIETAAVIASPVNGVVRTRMAEPGDMATAARTVYQISIMDPKWVRAYVSETQLKFVREGAEALVTTDTTEPLKARVGHISSEADSRPRRSPRRICARCSSTR